MLSLSKQQLGLLPYLINQGFKMVSCTTDTIQLTQQTIPKNDKIYIGVGAIVQRKGKILLVQEANGPVRGKWGFPSGLLNEGEMIKDGVVRELKEETNLIGHYQSILYMGQLLKSRWGKSELYFGCLVDIKDENIKLCDKELMDYKWVDKESYEILPLTGICKQGIKKLLLFL